MAKLNCPLWDVNDSLGMTIYMTHNAKSRTDILLLIFMMIFNIYIFLTVSCL